MKKRILSIVLCLVMLVGLLPVQAFANDYEDGTECAYCGHYHWGDYMCDECGLCSADCSNSECFTTTHCNECGACLMRNDFCKECRRCEDCMESEGGHCTDCGGCFLGERENLCEECGRCVDCAGEICEECHRCSECAAEDHCPECGIHLYDDPCAGCGKCIDCVEICEDCGYCEDCIEKYELHCEDCGACFEAEGRCTCSDDALHCLNCAGLICEQCGECEYESGRDFCLDCGLCEECCKYNSQTAGCSTGEVCVESVEWRQHKCENCGEVCFCDEAPCEYCGFCEECCKKISRENGCAEGTVCVESADWNTHFCTACGSCFHKASQCGYCGLCAVCCAANAEAAGCDCGDVCVKKDDFAQHLADYHNGTVSDDHTHKPKTEWSMNDTGHWYVCRFCGDRMSVVAAHIWDGDKCSVCGYEKNAKLRITVQPKDVTCPVSDPFAEPSDPYDMRNNTASFSVTVANLVPGTTLEYQWYQVRAKKDAPDDKEVDELTNNDNEYVVQGAQGDTLTISVPNDGCDHKYEYYCVITGKDAEGNTVSTAISRSALLRTVHNYGDLKPIEKEQGEGAGSYITIHFTDGPKAGTEITYLKGNRYHNQWCRGYDCDHTKLPAETGHNFGPKVYLGYGYGNDDPEQKMYYYGTTCADCGYENVYWYKQEVDAFYQITVVNTPGAYIVTDDDREIVSGYVSSGESLVVSAPYVNDENKVFSHWVAQPVGSGTLPEGFTIKNEIHESALGNAYLTMPACNITLEAVYSDKGPVNKVTIKGAGEDPVLVEDGVITVRVGTEFSVDTILSPEDAVEKRVIWTVYGIKATGKPELEFTSHQFSSTTTRTEETADVVTLKANETGTFRLNVRTVESHVLGQQISDTVLVRIVAKNAHVHDYDTTTVPATCTRSGYTLYTCKDAACGRTYKSDFVKATGHNDTNGDGLCDNFNMITKKVCGHKLNKEATMFGRTQIDKVQLTVSSPVRGGTPGNANLKDSTEARYYVATTDWDPVTENNKLGISTKYTVKVVLEAADDYGFKLNGLLGVGNTEFFINGSKAEVVSGDAQQVIITCVFLPNGRDPQRGGSTGMSPGSNTVSADAAAASVGSAGTGDAGIALYAAMGLLSLSGGAWVVGRKRKDK